jgi:hypothetical protein
VNQFIIFLLAFISILLTIVFALQNYHNQSTLADIEQDTRKRRSYWSRPNNWVRILTLVAVAGYTGISLWQVRVLKETERKQLRGYLGVTDLQFDCGDCLPTEDDLILAVADNFGQSPLYVINAIISITEYRIDEDFPEDDIYRFPGSISELIPRSMVLYPKAPYPLVFPVKDVQRAFFWEAKNGDYWLMIRGSVRYRDIFDDKWDNSFSGGPETRDHRSAFVR